MVYALPEGGVYEKLLSPRRSSNKQVLMRAFTGSPRSAANWMVHSSAPPLVNMQKESNIVPMSSAVLLPHSPCAR